ncbi:MAG TPA: PD-(D/E)XK nuclease family protein, partial [Thermoanaerobaculia bacterium]|nr:PD-(D/E)XK nuclease family protein [Thermoanaerobaculia bacterium]
TATWILGLDERRHPGRSVDDPVLSDEERRRINESMNLGLVLGGGRSEKRSRAMRACVSRLRGTVTFSHSGWNVRNLVQAGEVFPSPFVLEAFRQREDRREAGYEELAAATSPASGFVPESSRDLDEGEWWLARIDRAGIRGSATQAGLLALHPWLADGARARAARESPEFTIWDGSIGEAVPDVDPRRNRRPMSSSRLRKLAECPFGFFLREVLGIESPGEDERDPGRWLDPLALGKLLHDVFHRFHQELAREGAKPTVAAHRALIESIAEEKIQEWRDALPPRSELAFRNAREEILFACRTFLQLEEAHCREVTPKFFELAFGLPRGGSDSPLSSPEPVEIALGGDRSFLLRGSIDRVDEDSDGNFHVWDYKTGGLWSIKEGSALRGGRQMQHALYSLALESLLARAGCGGRVVRAGYFFPGRRGEGHRLALPDSPAEARRLLDGLFDLIAAGQFPHSPDADDCKFCEFVEVCGNPQRAALQARQKIAASSDPLLRTLVNRNG